MRDIPPRKRNLFHPVSDEPYRLSRLKLELFLRCPRCFYLDRRRGIAQPAGPPYSLNLAVDALLKREFDAYRVRREPHPLMQQYGIEAVPLLHPDLESWRDMKRGIAHLHTPTNINLFGAVDDVWINPEGTLFVVDYKATSSDRTVSLDDPWKQSYKRQLEIYEWLLRKNGFDVSSTGYFVLANARRDRPAFEGVLSFDIAILPYTGSDKWIEDALQEAHTCLLRDSVPLSHAECPFCLYRKAAAEQETLTQGHYSADDNRCR